MVSSRNYNRSIINHTQVLNRLNDALQFGIRDGGKWQCTNIEIQILVVKNASAFLDSVSKAELQNPPLKDSIAVLVKALAWILDNTNESVLSIAADATLKLASILPSSILQSCVWDLVTPLSSLLCYRQTEVSMSSAKALDLLLSTVKNEIEVWGTLKFTELVSHAIKNIRSFCGGAKPIEFFQVMASLLSTVLQKWPPTRFPVWNDDNVLRTLNDVLVKLDSCGKVEALKLLSSIALCGSGAAKLLENGEFLLRGMLQCVDNSQPHSVRIEGFKLAQCLAVMIINEERFSKMMSLCGEPILQAIIFGMSKPHTSSKKVSGEEISLISEACCLAVITTHWRGEHHVFFWKHKISLVLLDLLIEDSINQLCQNSLSLQEQISIAQAGHSSKLRVLRNHVLDILGWLAIHCEGGFNPEGHENKFCVDVLTTCACSAFLDATRIWRANENFDSSQTESATRAFLMMIYSPCKYIASKARSRLSELLEPNGRDILKPFMSHLKNILSRKSIDGRHDIICVMILACYIGSPETRSWVLEFSGLKILMTLLSWCLSNGVDEDRLIISSYLHNLTPKKTCCQVSSEDWEGKDLLMFYSLWGLAELIKHLDCIRNDEEISYGGTRYGIPELLASLKDICVKMSAPGVRWFASYALSSLGLYGFPSILGERVGKEIPETDHADTKLILKNGESLSAHGIILAIQCPLLLRLEEPHLANRTSGSSVLSCNETSGEFQREIRLSGRVERHLLLKILDFVYSGYLQAEEEHTKLLKALAKSCNLRPLMQMLYRERPKWGTPFPSIDLSLALGPIGDQFSDVIFEAKENGLQNCKCDICSSSVPHVHAHKVILASRCDYMRALFNCGMQESLLQSIKLDLSWEAMVKLIAWFYSDELPSPPSGCLWENMSDDEKLQALEPYVELCGISESWCLKEVQAACSSVVISRLDSARLSTKIMKFAVSFSLWELVEVAAACVASLYRQLCDSDELEDLNEDLVDMIRTVSVQYAQEGMGDSRLQKSSDDLMDSGRWC